MKKVILTSLGLVTAFGSAFAQGDMFMTQFFNNNNSTFIDGQSANYNWSFATANNIVTVANDISAGNTKSSSSLLPGEVTRGRGFFFLLPDNPAEGAGATFMYTTNTAFSDVVQNNPQPDWYRFSGDEALTGKTVGDIINIRYQTRVGGGGDFNSHIGIQVDGQWYFSSTISVLNTALGGGVWVDNNLANLSTESWIVGAFDGVNLDADLSDNATTSLNATDVITGYGFYADVNDAVGGGSRIRLNEYEIQVVPEPSTYALFAGLFALGALIIRRRRS